MNFDVYKLRQEFPALHQQVYGKTLIYMDNGATTQKPKRVIDAMNKYYELQNANVHRGVHYLSQVATDLQENARSIVKNYLNANSIREIIFTRGTTESLNLLAHSLGKKYVSAGDEIILSVAEHHANIVPWQMLCEEKGCVLKIVPIDENGEFQLDEYKKLLNERTKIVSIAHITNSLGTINPVKEIIDLAHANGSIAVIDGAQGVMHQKIDVQQLDCDFYVFSGHKIFGPMGIGIVYGKEKMLEEMPPYQTGGEMIDQVSFEKTTFADLPFKFEAGTPNVGGIIGLGEALNFVQDIGIENIIAHEDMLLNYANTKLIELGGVRIFAEKAKKAAVISFEIEGVHHYDAGTILDKLGIAVRTGHHCAQPAMRHFGVAGTIRASLTAYNTIEEIDALITGLQRVKNMFL